MGAGCGLTQDTYLFHDTGATNLRFATADATDADVDAAVAAASVDRVVASVAQGYDIVGGTRGHRFPGGERQRLAIAGWLRNPRILVLDEASSALDTETERAVQAALDELARARMTIAIADWLCIAWSADRIVVVDRGRVLESDAHTDRLARVGRYCRSAGELTG